MKTNSSEPQGCVTAEGWARNTNLTDCARNEHSAVWVAIGSRTGERVCVNIHIKRGERDEDSLKRIQKDLNTNQMARSWKGAYQ